MKKTGDTKLTVKKSAPSRKAAKDTNMPKRPANAFFVFMEAFRKQFKEENPTIKSVVAVGKAGGAKWKLMSEFEKAPFVAKAEQRKTAAISSVESVISNNDLLTEILVKLPVLSLLLFKLVSKQWFSLIKNVSYCRNLDPLSGLFLIKFSFNFYESFIYDFVPLDIRIPLLATNFTFGLGVQDDAEILHSCNGLLLYCTLSGELYVNNPSITNMFKVIPRPDNVAYYHNSYSGGLQMAFDPTKSPHYKVIYAEINYRDLGHILVQIHTYSSETGNWSLCGYQFPEHSFFRFKDGVYWNDAIYWLNYRPEGKLYKLDVMNENPVGKDNECSRHFTIYEKGNVYSQWSVKYIVNLDDIIKPVPEMLDICKIIFGIVLKEREEDSFLVMELDNKVVQYKIVSKTLSTISDLGPHDCLINCFRFIPSFANV